MAVILLLVTFLVFIVIDFVLERRKKTVNANIAAPCTDSVFRC